LPISGLSAQARFRGWATLSEHKWSSFGERRGDAAIDRIITAYSAALKTVADALAAGSAVRFLEIPNLPIERRTAVPSEKQL